MRNSGADETRIGKVNILSYSHKLNRKYQIIRFLQNIPPTGIEAGSTAVSLIGTAYLTAILTALEKVGPKLKSLILDYDFFLAAFLAAII